jgi:hypothetical protein
MLRRGISVIQPFVTKQFSHSVQTYTSSTTHMRQISSELEKQKARMDMHQELLLSDKIQRDFSEFHMARTRAKRTQCEIRRLEAGIAMCQDRIQRGTMSASGTGMCSRCIISCLCIFLIPLIHCFPFLLPQMWRMSTPQTHRPPSPSVAVSALRTVIFFDVIVILPH